MQIVSGLIIGLGLSLAYTTGVSAITDALRPLHLEGAARSIIYTVALFGPATVLTMLGAWLCRSPAHRPFGIALLAGFLPLAGGMLLLLAAMLIFDIAPHPS
ncbi:hypothetical protein ACFVMC_19090 [Nocardia sp. NPDC127579]|uniref:hypothetical protein n=1 Tax=Nocardia sp. NPDC127579 TaxID=3345402 RepID=UPI003632D1A2